MSKTYKRKIKLVWTPEVAAGNEYDRNIKVNTGTWVGKTRIECTGELSMSCTKTLIRNLRRALKETAAQVIAHAQRQVDEAEGPL